MFRVLWMGRQDEAPQQQDVQQEDKHVCALGLNHCTATDLTKKEVLTQ